MSEHKHDWRYSIVGGVYYCAVSWCDETLDDDVDDSFAAHCEGYI